jgi:hypothetical protein
MSNWIWTALIGGVAALMVFYFAARIRRSTSPTSAAQMIGLLIAVDIVSAVILVFAFPDYWWIAASAGIAAALGLVVVLAKTVTISRAHPKTRVDSESMSFSSRWRRLLWSSLGMAVIIVLVALVSRSLIPLLLLVLPIASLVLGLAAATLVGQSVRHVSEDKAP